MKDKWNYLALIPGTGVLAIGIVSLAGWIQDITSQFLTSHGLLLFGAAFVAVGHASIVASMPSRHRLKTRNAQPKSDDGWNVLAVMVGSAFFSLGVSLLLGHGLGGKSPFLTADGSLLFGIIGTIAGIAFIAAARPESVDHKTTQEPGTLRGSPTILPQHMSDHDMAALKAAGRAIKNMDRAIAEKYPEKPN